MDFLKQHLSKRYFLFFLFFFLVWYPASFFIFIAYSVTHLSYMYVAIVTLLPALIFLFSFFYFRKSVNDWNDRFMVAFGWLLMQFLLAAVLVKPMYGFDWTSILNFDQLLNAWSPFLAVILSGMLARQLKHA